MNRQELNQLDEIIDKRAEKVVINFLQAKGFTIKKITDTPTEGLSIVNRNYVNLNGTTANRPKSSVATKGQHYFTTDSSILMIYGGTGWVDTTGSIVALNN